MAHFPDLMLTTAVWKVYCTIYYGVDLDLINLNNCHSIEVVIVCA